MAAGTVSHQKPANPATHTTAMKMKTRLNMPTRINP
jgi:hypothetical protein